MLATGGETRRGYYQQSIFIINGNNVLSAQLLEVSLSPVGVETVLLLERDAWSMVN